MPPPRVIHVSAPARVRELLGHAPDGAVRVLHRGRHAVYVEVAGWCVGVVGSDATAVPCALRSTLPDLLSLGSEAHVSAGVLHLDATPLVVGRIVDVRVPRLDPRGAVRSAAALPSTAPLDRPLDPQAVAQLVGRGDGLTPLGDDILCGWLATHRAAGVATPAVDAAVRELMPRTTLLSATLLDCAMHGEGLPEFAAYVASLGTPDEPTAATTLAGVGHTSGAGLLHGARLALTELLHTEGIAA